MTTALLSLTIQNYQGVLETHDGRPVARRDRVDKHFRAVLSVTPDDDLQGRPLGTLTVTIEATPERDAPPLPQMTPDQTKDWLVSRLKVWMEHTPSGSELRLLSE